MCTSLFRLKHVKIKKKPFQFIFVILWTCSNRIKNNIGKTLPSLMSSACRVQSLFLNGWLSRPHGRDRNLDSKVEFLKHAKWNLTVYPTDLSKQLQQICLVTDYQLRLVKLCKNWISWAWSPARIYVKVIYNYVVCVCT